MSWLTKISSMMVELQVTHIFIGKKQKCTLKIKSNQILLFNLRKRFLVHGILMNINMLSALELNKFHQMTSKWWEREKKPPKFKPKRESVGWTWYKIAESSVAIFSNICICFSGQTDDLLMKLFKRTFRVTCVYVCVSTIWIG